VTRNSREYEEYRINTKAGQAECRYLGRAPGITLIVEPFPDMCKALGSISSTSKN
jgi:hypothetical protein